MTKLLSREELLGGGLSGRAAKQASAVVALIENRVAYLAAESQQVAARSSTTMTQAARAQTYLEALAQGRTRTTQPSAYAVERYAPQWADLAPDSSAGCALVARLLGQKYRLAQRATPYIQSALGLNTADVQQTYQQLYGEPLATIYTSALSLAEQMRWSWAHVAGRLENLSPFWTAFALTLTEIVGAGILALPIALANVGPLAGVAALVAFGLINILTLTGVVEAITRNGSMRYGSAYFGRLSSDYLGRAATLTFSASLFVINVLSLVAYYAGIAGTLNAATGIPKMFWVGLLFVCALYVLRRQSLSATIASALVIGFVNIGLIVLLTLLTLPHVTFGNLAYVNLPSLDGRAFDSSLLGLIFGTVLGAFFGHTAVGSMAKTVLRRDPSGRTLLWGNVAAMGVALLLYTLWVIAVNGALSPAVLSQTAGTALIPLAAVVGPVVHIAGALFTVLGMGMATMHYALALFNQVQEWLPSQRAGRVWLGLLPTTGIFLFTLWLLWTGQESFTGPYSFMGAIIAPLLAGIFPMLLLVVSRRRGEYAPATSWRWLGHPLVVIGICLVFFAGLLVHGLFIWSDPIPRGIALVTCLGMLILTASILRGGVLQPYTVIELRVWPGASGRASFQVLRRGSPLPSAVQVNRQSGEERLQTSQGEIANIRHLKSLSFCLPAAPAPSSQMLKVWVHQVSSEGDSVGVRVRVKLEQEGQPDPVELTGDGNGKLLVPLTGCACWVELSLAQL